MVHDYYGCDSGCCGYATYGLDKSNNIVFERFDFHHVDTEEEVKAHIYDLFNQYEVEVDFSMCELSEY